MKTNTWLTVGIVVLLLVTFGIVVIPKNETSGGGDSSAFNVPYLEQTL